MTVFTFYDGVESTPRKVTAERREEGLVLRGADGAALRAWKWESLVAAGWPSKAAPGLLSHREESDARLVVPKESWDALVGGHALLEAGDPHGRAGFLGAIAAAGVAAIAVLVAFFPPALDAMAGIAPRAWEDRLGASVFASMTEKSACKIDPLSEKALKDFMQKVGGDGREYRIGVIDSPRENAFALPGANVVILSGALHKATREELAGILAHEAGHVSNRDSFRAYARAMGVGLLIGLASGREGAGGANAAHRLVELKNGRGAEAKADAHAVRALMRAGFDPSGLVSFLKRLEKKDRAVSEYVPEWLMDHPGTAERIAVLTVAADTMKKGKTRFDKPFTDAAWRKISKLCSENKPKSPLDRTGGKGH